MTSEAAQLNVQMLEQLIQSERDELMQIHAMTRCLHDVLLYSDDDDATMHADVAKVIARLLNECVERLEKMVARFKAEDSSDG